MNPYDIFRNTMQANEAGRERGLAALVGKAATAPREERAGLLGMVMKQDANAGFNALKHFQAMDEQGLEGLGRYAAAFDALPDEQKATAYPEFARQAQQHGIPAPPEWQPEFAPHISKLSATLSQRAGGGVPSGVQEFQYMTQGLGGDDVTKARRIALGLDGRASSAAIAYKVIKGGDGVERLVAVDPRTPGAMTIDANGFGGPQAPPQAGGGMPVVFDDADIPQPVQAALTQREWTQGTPDIVRGAGPSPQPAGPNMFASRPEEESAYLTEQAKQRAQLDSLGDRGQLEARNAGLKTVAETAAKTEAEVTAKRGQTKRDAGESMALLDGAEQLLYSATGGAAGATYDKALGLFGQSTKGSQANAQLRILAAKLTAKVPRMEGPQSNADVQSYREAAGDLANANLPTGDRLAALRILRALNAKYSVDGTLNAGGSDDGAVDDLLSKYGIR